MYANTSAHLSQYNHYLDGGYPTQMSEYQRQISYNYGFPLGYNGVPPFGRQDQTPPPSMGNPRGTARPSPPAPTSTVISPVNGHHPTPSPDQSPGKGISPETSPAIQNSMIIPHGLPNYKEFHQNPSHLPVGQQSSPSLTTLLPPAPPLLNNSSNVSQHHNSPENAAHLHSSPQTTPSTHMATIHLSSPQHSSPQHSSMHHQHGHQPQQSIISHSNAPPSYNSLHSVDSTTAAFLAASQPSIYQFGNLRDGMATPHNLPTTIHHDEDAITARVTQYQWMKREPGTLSGW